MLDDALIARIAAAKQRLLDGGLLQLVSWGVPVGERDERGRITYAYSDLDAFIEERTRSRPWERSAPTRSDDIKLIVLDPLAITDEDLVPMGRTGFTRPQGQTGRRADTGRRNRYAIRLRSHRDPLGANFATCKILGKPKISEPKNFNVV